jgi:hypothetical protein
MRSRRDCAVERDYGDGHVWRRTSYKPTISCQSVRSQSGAAACTAAIAAMSANLCGGDVPARRAVPAPALPECRPGPIGSGPGRPGAACVRACRRVSRRTSVSRIRASRPATPGSSGDVIGAQTATQQARVTVSSQVVTMPSMPVRSRVLGRSTSTRYARRHLISAGRRRASLRDGRLEASPRKSSR